MARFLGQIENKFYILGLNKLSNLFEIRDFIFV